MNLIDWRDDFSVGVGVVDLEHRALIDLINDLHASMGEGATYDTVIDALGEIYAQISAHFALEEKVMRDREYAYYPSHKESHEELLDELRDIMDRVEDDGRYDETRLSRELERWFTEHFRTHDAKLHQYLQH